MRRLLILAASAGALLSVAHPASAETACADLAARVPAHTRIISADPVALGALEAKQGGSAATPAFCRVKGEITAVPGSEVGFELWLPAGGWNGKFEMVGNGGYSSSMAFQQMARLLAAGYAVAATDTGHQGDDPDFVVGHPEALTDWSYRAVHVTAVTSKALIKTRYASAAKHSYFSGCSTGGHQAMSEAERYPLDFDGIIAGASGGDRTHLNAGFLWQFVKNHRVDGSEIIPASKLPMITAAVVKNCGGDDGGRAGGHAGDDWLDDPLLCKFSAESLRCPAADASDCLTGEQVEALKAMYAGAHDPASGALVAHAWPMGSEATGGPPTLRGWSLYWSDPRDHAKPARMSFWQDWAGFGPDWDPRSFDFGKDMRATDAKLAATVNAMNPDLDGFRRRGGKLIAYHGEADPVVPFLDSIDLYQAVRAREGAKTEAFYRLFLSPGMGHCGGGPGLGAVDPQPALESWVEHGQAPDRIVARHDMSPTAFTRPLCAYPQKAVYDGKGDPAQADAYACRIVATR